MLSQINTARCQFNGSVKYFSSIRGNSGHWAVSGGSHIYSAHKKGFTVYLHGKGFSARRRNAFMWGWRVDWCGVEKAKPLPLPSKLSWRRGYADPATATADCLLCTAR